MNAHNRFPTIRSAAPRSRMGRRPLAAGPLGLCLLLALVTVTTAAAAREVKLAANSPSCPEAHADQTASSPVPGAAPSAGSSEARVKPSVHSDAIRGGRLQSPRWHSFLPGMFR